MALWTLLLGICFGIGVVSALGGAEDLGVGFGGYALALGVGSAIGTCSVCILARLGGIVEPRISNISSNFRKEWYAGTLYVFAIAWIVFTGLVATWTASGLISYVIRAR
jgi:hypothetical protein